MIRGVPHQGAPFGGRGGFGQPQIAVGGHPMPQTQPPFGVRPPMPSQRAQIPDQDRQYQVAFTQITNSEDYKKDDEDGKKTRIGDFIYNYIEKLSSPDDAPKITGMIIDLDEKDLIESV